MAETPVFRYEMADYLDVGTEEAPDIQVMSVFENIDESPNAETTEKHYTANKSTTTITTGYNTNFPITGDLYKNNKVIEFLRDIAEEQKLGVQANYYRIRLYQPIEGKSNTYYARKFLVGFSISTIGGGGGEIVNLDGEMNSLKDAVIGEFNTETRTFTAKDELESLPPVDESKPVF